MLKMEYSIHPRRHKYACSTMSSETLSGSCGSRNNRIRTVRFVRRNNTSLSISTLNGRHGHILGFSIRGGHEHGTGFFVSSVEPGSEAHSQGLKAGDQIIRVNGFTVADAVHKEVLQLILNHTHLILKVRSVGMIPVKEKKSDVLTWQIVSDINCSSRSSPQFEEKNRDVRINIMVAPRSKLGCGICKGPEWKPGIFVQFTKEGGIAREAGLRPGDQILQCNNIDFSDILFNEAVNLMKTSRQLDLVVRKAAASELFPGESSGYNSSASSVTEDQSPSWTDSKRLSIVTEENQNLEDRFHQDRYCKRGSNINKSNLAEWEEEPVERNMYKPTIINLSENGTTIKNNGTESQTTENNTSKTRTPDMCEVPEERDKKIVVEVHKSDEGNKNGDSSTSSFNSPASKTTNAGANSNSLSSAICMEINRRAQNKAITNNEPSIDEQLQMKKVLKGMSHDQQFQHHKLMNEFKQAHLKMFKAPGDPDYLKSNGALGMEIMNRLAHKEMTQKLSDRLLNIFCEDSDQNDKETGISSPPPPPPPPPFKISTNPTPPPLNTGSNTLKPNKLKPKAPPVPAKYSVISYRQPPPCPTPDYDTLSIISSSSSMKPNRALHDSVEMESLDSFKINNPSNTEPKPPNTYFKKNLLTAQLSNGSNSSVSSLDKPKSVSVIIGEYGTVRSQRGRSDFLKNRSSGTGNGCKTSSLANELSQTLNKSNLRKRTESMDDILNSPQIKPQSNGSVRISVSNLSKEFARSTSDLTEEYDTSSRIGNRIMININRDKQFNSPDRIIRNGYALS